jgi:hypothetical protein
MTATPSVVAATVVGDKLECEVEGVGKLTVTMGPALKCRRRRRSCWRRSASWYFDIHGGQRSPR